MMRTLSSRVLGGLSAIAILSSQPALVAHAQQAAPVEEAAAATLSDDQLEVLVARIALYPDELVAAISAASLFPLQIVEAQRFLEAKKKNADLKPKSDWDGSVISLLNYPEVVKMMSDDLDWTQSLGDALANQQKDVLIAIQQLRDEAVAKNIIKTDDKVTVVTENNNIVIRAADPEKIYIPQYPPEMLYEPGYAAAPISYYPQPYDNYYYPGAGFFAAAVTGVAWAAAVNWDNWGVWGGRWNGDVDIDCNNCLNGGNFNGKMKLNDVDWSKVDRSKLNIGKDQFAKLDRSTIKAGLQADDRNRLSNRASEMRSGGERSGVRDASTRSGDIRKNTVQGLQQKQQSKAGKAGNRTNASRPDARPANSANRSAKPAARPAGKPNRSQMASRPDNRGRQPSALGNMNSSGRREAISSQRGSQSMAGGHRGGSRAHHRPPQRQHGGGGRGGGRGGGGRGGGGRR